MNSNQNTHRVPSQKVLVTLHPDRFVQVYAESHIQVHFEHVPYLPTDDGARLCEDLIELKLPKPYREIYFPGYVRGQSVHREVRPTVLANELHVRRILHTLNLLTNVGEEAQVWML
jgi:hypothetical protein